MERLSQGMTKRGAGPSALPDVLAVLAAKKLHIRRAQTTMIFGQSNSGKSMLSLFLAVNMKVRTLYVSADTDSETVRMRAAAMAMQKSYDEIEEMYYSSGRVLIEEAMQEFDRRLVWSWNPSPTMDDLLLEILAADEAWGAMPEMIVIDNLSNLTQDSAEEFAELRRYMSDFHQLARKTGAAIVVLHHASENEKVSKPDWPAPKHAILGKLSALPETIWSVAMVPQENKFLLAPVKNRHGLNDPKAQHAIHIYVDAPRMSFYSTSQEMQLARSRAEYE